MRVLLFASLIALCACQPKAEEAAAPAAASGDPPAAMSQPPAATNPVRFDAKSKEAVDLTGAIHLTAIAPTGPDDQPSMKLEAEKGFVYETNLVPGGATTARHIDWTGVFGQVVDPDDTLPNGSPILDIHAISAETVPPNAPKGGYCGKDKTLALAVAFPIGVMNGSYMGIAAFKGDKWPPKDESALCGVFNYSPPMQPLQ